MIIDKLLHGMDQVIKKYRRAILGAGTKDEIGICLGSVGGISYSSTETDCFEHFCIVVVITKRQDLTHRDP